MISFIYTFLSSRTLIRNSSFYFSQDYARILNLFKSFFCPPALVRFPSRWQKQEINKEGWAPSPTLHSARTPPFLGVTQREKRKVNERRGCKVKSLLVRRARAAPVRSS